ncbi:serine hydrolase domain-containing protein [Winogradskyella flava]|uniref:serine hydrolase domain-containing protein n=1 Tax=Winogradskyella flava TaxID=1884876 RepID=UPI00248F5674|nr:serine hydrolase [Winogradskyella flava]
MSYIAIHVRYLSITIILLFTLAGCSQTTFEDYLGGWEVKIESKEVFNFNITLNAMDKSKVYLQIEGQSSTTRLQLEQQSNQIYNGSYKNQLNVKVDLREDIPIVFFKIGHHLCAIEITEQKEGIWIGQWNLLITESAPFTFLMSLDINEDGSGYASIFFEEPTFHYMYADDFKLDENGFSFIDIRSRIEFKAQFQYQTIDLEMKFLEEKIRLKLKPRPVSTWQLGTSNNLAKTSYNKDNTRFKSLVMDIENDSLERTHSVVIAQKNTIIFEKYFDGFSANTLHDTRSLAKSFASASIGIAIKEGFLKDEYLPIKPFFERSYPAIDWSKGKDSVNLFHLMTMSSGIDAIDFGLNRNSYANEGTYQNQTDWTKHILEAPMVNTPGKSANYGSGSPHLLGPILANQIAEELPFYLHKKLFKPLSISNYRIQLTNQSEPYFGGGWYFTSIDLVKFGQLYLNGGNYNEKQIIPKEWVEKSMQKHVVLENTFDQNKYGFLFWHKTYQINEQQIESIEARGAGGQYLFIIPELDLVAVITSGNYTNNKGFQPERIMQDYILKEIVKLKP